MDRPAIPTNPRHRKPLRELNTSVWPPRGAVLLSAVVLQSRMFKKTRRAAEIEIYGRVKVTPNLFGMDAGAVAKRVFGGALSSKEVLDHHSIFGFYRQFLDVSREATLAESLAAGDTRAWHKHFPCGALCGVSRGALKCCTECVREDVDRDGFAVWYACHQIPFLTVCPKHRCMLVWQCGQCGNALQQGLSTWLPGDVCRRCGAATESPPETCSPGELQLAVLCAHICSTGDSLFRPLTWSAFVQRVVEEVGELDLAALVIEDSIMRRWEVESLPELCERVGGPHPDFVKRELQNLSSVGNVVGRLIVRNAIEEVFGPSDFERIASQACEAVRKGPMAVAEQLAAEAGVPIGAVRLLAQGWNVRAVQSVANIGDPALRKFVIGLTQGDVLPEDAPAGSVEIIESITGGVTDLKRMRRETARAAVSAALTRGCAIPRTWNDPLGREVCWLRTHDSQWLEENVPYKADLRLGEDASKKEQYRAELLAHKRAQPDTGIDDAARRAWPAARWLYMHDRDWFNEEFPSRYRLKYRNETHQKQAFRSKVREFVQIHPGVTRSQISEALGGTWSWLTMHDMAWTLKLVPASIRMHAGRSTAA